MRNPVNWVGNRSSGFTLIELLLVITLIGLVTTLAISGFNSIGSSTNIQRAGDYLADQLVFARQQALTRNAIIDVRLLEDGAGNYRSLQIFERKGTNETPISRQRSFPTGIVILPSPSLSPLLDLSPSGTHPGPCQILAFQANGEPYFSNQGSVDISQSFLTLGLERDSAGTTTPKNYYTIQIYPDTGLVKSYRP